MFNLFPEGAKVAVKKPAKSYLKINLSKMVHGMMYVDYQDVHGSKKFN